MRQILTDRVGIVLVDAAPSAFLEVSGPFLCASDPRLTSSYSTTVKVVRSRRDRARPVVDGDNGSSSGKCRRSCNDECASATLARRKRKSHRHRAHILEDSHGEVPVPLGADCVGPYPRKSRFRRTYSRTKRGHIPIMHAAITGTDDNISLVRKKKLELRVRTAWSRSC